jgi:hypothetical protein
MAHESSNPKVRIMFVTAIVAGISLVVFDQAFRSYYNSMFEEEEAEKVLTVPPKQLQALRAAEQQRLTSAALPLDRAMKELGTRGRDDKGLKDLAKVDITPEASNDTGALVGWGLLGNKLPAPAAAPAPDHAALGDGGVALGADGGAEHAATGDAAAPKADAAVAPAPRDPHAPAPVPAPPVPGH